MITAVERGDVDVGIVPIENSIEGSISVTLDTLAFDTDLLVQREVDLPVSLNLCAPKGTKIADITTVVSHPNPLGQVRMWMAKHLPDATSVAANSTAEAANQVASSKRKGMASIGTKQGAAHAGLQILARDIEDHPDNLTRFVIVGYGIPAPSGHDKTSIVCFQREDKPGSLLAILQEFSARAINLTKLESRPAKRSLGDYCFFIDFEGPPRRRARRRLPAHARGQAGRGEVPRLVPRRRGRRVTCDGGPRPRHGATPNSWLEGLRAQVRAEDGL